MSYTARKLIQKSFYLSQVVARELQTVSGQQLTDGLELLNALLDIKGSDIRLIPYFQRYTFNTVAGQESYFIPDLLSVEAITFNIGPVRFAMGEKQRREYFGENRVDNVQSLPFSWHLERELGGARIYLYFLPQQIMPINLSGKFGLTNVLESTDLSLTYDLFYIEYLRYALAEYICSDWGVNFPEQAAMKYKEIRKKLMDISPPDLRVKKLSSFSKEPALNWALINIPGWIP